MKVRIYTYVKPTEDINKVKKAVENVFSGELLVIEEDRDLFRIEGYSSDINSLSKLRDLIRLKQIIPAARSYLMRKTRGNVLTIILHKQAAFMKNISLIDSDRESPLGAIWIEIGVETNSVERVIDWLAPRQHSGSQRKTNRDK